MELAEMSFCVKSNPLRHMFPIWLVRETTRMLSMYRFSFINLLTGPLLHSVIQKWKNSAIITKAGPFFNFGQIFVNMIFCKFFCTQIWKIIRYGKKGRKSLFDFPSTYFSIGIMLLQCIQFHQKAVINRSFFPYIIYSSVITSLFPSAWFKMF